MENFNYLFGWVGALRQVGTYSEDPETGAIECDTVHCREVAQDSSVEAHALIVADRTDGAEALGPRQFPPSEDLHCCERRSRPSGWM